jgi:hypothetical protein
MGKRIPKPPPGKTLVGFDEIPDWVYTFTVPDDFDLDNATSAEIRAAYQDWEKRGREWKATHETPSTAELIADEQMMADAPFNPNAEIEAGTL